MPLYLYKGYDAATGANRKGKVEAESQKAARTKLRQKERIIVAELKEEASLDKVREKKQRLFSPKVGMQDLSIMTRQFATLQSAHVPLDESLKALTAQVEHVVLRNTLAAVKDQVSEGRSLADASASYPGVFNKLYVNMVRAGESSGTLHIVLERLADFMEWQVKMKGEFLSAVTYPAIMIFASIGVVGFLFISVVPKLTKVFANLRVTLPWYTEALIGFSELLQNFWYLFIIAAVGGGLGFRHWVGTDKGRHQFDEMSLKVPIFGAIVMRMNLSRMTRTLSTLLSSGVPIIQSLEITKNVVSNTILSDVVDQAKIDVQEGKSLAVCFEKSGRFPPLVVHMIATGERTGELEKMLSHVAVAYDAEVERRVATMISIIEPMMVLMMTGIVVVVIIAMLLPMLSVMNQIR